MSNNQSFGKILSYYSAARERAQRSKSAWNLILIPPGLVGWLGSWYGMFRIVWGFHRVLYPQHDFRNFWQDGISPWSFAFSFLMLFGPFFGALCIGLIIANLVAWLIPPARRALNTEAEGFAGTGFRESTESLLRLAKWAVPMGLFVALVAAALLKSLR
jgi:hypothetical protein